MNVKLVSCSQPVSPLSWTDSTDPVALVEQAASICYNSMPTKSFAIAEACYKSGHTSVWEHIHFMFLVTGVSRSLLAQLTRHRIAGFSVRSQRYCNEYEFGFVEPSKIEANSYMHNCFHDAMDFSHVRYQELVDLGAKKEDARAVLPNACQTSLYISANARALFSMSNLRLCSRAQEEIRELFRLMKSEVANISPLTASHMVPKCQINAPYIFCTENDCCGRAPRLSDVYAADLEKPEVNSVTFYVRKKSDL